MDGFQAGDQKAQRQSPFEPIPGRIKSKRWSRAPKYTYDGNEWGESDDETDTEAPALPELPEEYGDGVAEQAKHVPGRTEHDSAPPEPEAAANGHAGPAGAAGAAAPVLPHAAEPGPAADGGVVAADGYDAGKSVYDLYSDRASSEPYEPSTVLEVSTEGADTSGTEPAVAETVEKKQAERELQTEPHAAPQTEPHAEPHYEPPAESHAAPHAEPPAAPHSEPHEAASEPAQRPASTNPPSAPASAPTSAPTSRPQSANSAVELSDPSDSGTVLTGAKPIAAKELLARRESTKQAMRGASGRQLPALRTTIEPSGSPAPGSGSPAPDSGTSLPSSTMDFSGLSKLEEELRRRSIGDADVANVDVLPQTKYTPPPPSLLQERPMTAESFDSRRLSYIQEDATNFYERDERLRTSSSDLTTRFKYRDSFSTTTDDDGSISRNSSYRRPSRYPSSIKDKDYGGASSVPSEYDRSSIYDPDAAAKSDIEKVRERYQNMNIKDPLDDNSSGSDAASFNANDDRDFHLAGGMAHQDSLPSFRRFDSEYESGELTPNSHDDGYSSMEQARSNYLAGSTASSDSFQRRNFQGVDDYRRMSGAPENGHGRSVSVQTDKSESEILADSLLESLQAEAAVAGSGNVSKRGSLGTSLYDSYQASFPTTDSDLKDTNATMYSTPDELTPVAGLAQKPFDDAVDRGTESDLYDHNDYVSDGDSDSSNRGGNFAHGLRMLGAPLPGPPWLFSEIIKEKSIVRRRQLFDDAREREADHDCGLEEWLEYMLQYREDVAPFKESIVLGDSKQSTALQRTTSAIGHSVSAFKPRNMLVATGGRSVEMIEKMGEKGRGLFTRRKIFGSKSKA
ncbi:uncharacterized protein V1510DRAFT_312388 [Dipodascopsis tothii]|uniref:uncharacterized protein n=1 Tax=Dipodascopsis tothii TaxID=44089 RepID=UPI0034CEED2C